MTNNVKYKSPASIRNEDFPRRMRGLDADKVYEYLDLLADQIQACDEERRAVRAENERLQGELQRMRSEMADLEGAGDRVNGQVVELLSQAQLVAEEMVEDVSRDARDRLSQARAQERKILEEAMATAEQTRRDAEALIRWTAPGVMGGSGEGSRVNESGRHSAPDVAAATAELEQVRSFARAAQAQMQSIIESFSSEVGRLGTAPAVSQAGMPVAHQNGSGAYDVNGWQLDEPRGNARDPWALD